MLTVNQAIDVITNIDAFDNPTHYVGNIENMTNRFMLLLREQSSSMGARETEEERNLSDVRYKNMMELGFDVVVYKAVIRAAVGETNLANDTLDTLRKTGYVIVWLSGFFKSASAKTKIDKQLIDELRMIKNFSDEKVRKLKVFLDDQCSELASLIKQNTINPKVSTSTDTKEMFEDKIFDCINEATDLLFQMKIFSDTIKDVDKVFKLKGIN